jgi:hypothetical protein
VILISPGSESDRKTRRRRGQGAGQAADGRLPGTVDAKVVERAAMAASRRPR